MLTVPSLVHNSSVKELSQCVKRLYVKREKPKEYLNYPLLSLTYTTKENQSSINNYWGKKHMYKINGYPAKDLSIVNLILDQLFHCI